MSAAPPSHIIEKHDDDPTAANNNLKEHQDATEPAAPPTAAAAAAEAQEAGWVSTYSSLKSSLPKSISSHLPQPATLSTQVSSLATTSSAHLSSLQKSTTSAAKDFHSWRKEVGTTLAPDQFFKQAYSITNTTQVLLNVSLNQLSPLFYTVLAPNETYEVRVPAVYFAVEVRPHTSPSTAYTPWSVTWPILIMTGPIVAATSLLLVPIVAIAAGGSALASLTGFGASVAEGAGAAVGTFGSASATAAGLVAKAANLPGGNKVKGKLVEAGKKAWGEKGSDVVGGLVKYLGKGTAVAAGAGVLKVGEQQAKVEEFKEKEKKEKEKKKVAEVDVTGLELEKVLRCETGKRKVDKALLAAFKNLEMKDAQFKASTNPVLNICGGPELEVRGTKQFLVFYPLTLVRVVDVEAEPLPPSQVPPTAEEESFLRDSAVVESEKDAAEAVKVAPTYGEGNKSQVDELVQGVQDVNISKGKGKENEKVAGTEPTKGWFGWGK